MQSSCQLLVLPLSSSADAHNLQDAVINQCMRLYPNNYQTYSRECLDGNLQPGSCLLVKRQREQSGLSASTNADRLRYIANLLVYDVPNHPTRRKWLTNALQDLSAQVHPLIQHQGLKSIAFYARPLIYPTHAHQTSDFTRRQSNTPVPSADLHAPVMDWENDIRPLIANILNNIPKVKIDIHLPTQLADGQK